MQTESATVASDEQAIRQIIQDMESAWNRGDSAAFVEHLADDADFIDILGMHHQGRERLEAGHRQILNTIYRGSRLQYTIEGIRFMRPDVAIAFLRGRMRSHLAVPVADPRRSAETMDEQWHEAQAHPTLILAKDNGAWRIVFHQNTHIAGS